MQFVNWQYLEHGKQKKLKITQQTKHTQIQHKVKNHNKNRTRHTLKMSIKHNEGHKNKQKKEEKKGGIWY